MSYRRETTLRPVHAVFTSRALKFSRSAPENRPKIPSFSWAANQCCGDCLPILSIVFLGKWLLSRSEPPLVPDPLVYEPDPKYISFWVFSRPTATGHHGSTFFSQEKSLKHSSPKIRWRSGANVASPGALGIKS